MNTTNIPKGPCLIVLVGPSGGGKSSFCEKNFAPNEVVSTDAIRQWLTGDLSRQDKNNIVFDEFSHRIQTRLRAGQRVVADATHIRNGARVRTAEIGYALNVPVYYVVINRSVVGKMQTGGWRNSVRTDEGVSLIMDHETTFQANLPQIMSGDSDYFGEGAITVIDTTTDRPFEVIQPLSRDRHEALNELLDRGFTTLRVVGDVHGNIAELQTLLENTTADTHVLFMGDIVDYGNASWRCVEVVEWMLSQGMASMVRGNHERKIARYVEQTNNGGEFTGNLSGGNLITINQLKAMSPIDEQNARRQMTSMTDQSADWIQMGSWMFVHAAAHEQMFNNPLFRAKRNSRLESRAVFGQTDGTFDADGLPVRMDEWHETDIPVGHSVMLGHSILSREEPQVFRNTRGASIVYLDTGSSKGGFLSHTDFEIVRPKKKKVDPELVWSEVFKGK